MGNRKPKPLTVEWIRALRERVAREETGKTVAQVIAEGRREVGHLIKKWGLEEKLVLGGKSMDSKSAGPSG